MMISGVTFSVRIWIKHHEIMDPCCLVSTVQTAGDGVILGGLFSWHNWCTFVYMAQSTRVFLLSFPLSPQ